MLLYPILSNLRIIRERDEEAETVLNNIYNIIKKTDENDDNFPDHDMLMNISKNFAEINLFDTNNNLLDTKSVSLSPDSSTQSF